MESYLWKAWISLFHVLVFGLHTYVKAQRMYILQANVPPLLQWIMIWKSCANPCAGKFAVVESRLYERFSLSWDPLFHYKFVISCSKGTRSPNE